MAISKAAMLRLVKSDFYDDLICTIKAWDYYLTKGDCQEANEMATKWGVAKLALKLIIGKYYGFSRNSETYSIVNEADHNDILFSGKSAQALTVDDYMTNVRVKTPRGSFTLVTLSKDQMEAQGWSYHHEDCDYYIMTKSNRAFAVSKTA